MVRVIISILFSAVVGLSTQSYAYMAGSVFAHGVPPQPAPPATYLAQDNFNSAGADLTWTTSAGTPDFDYTTTTFEGAQALFMDGSSTDQVVYTDFTPTAGQPQEFFVAFRMPARVLASNREILTFRTGASLRGAVYMNTSGSFLVQAFGGTISSASVTTTTTNVWYYVWVKYMKGSGSNALFSLGFSTDGIRPTSGNNYVESTDGTSTADVTRVQLNADYSNGTNYISVIFDKVRIDDAAIGDNPS